MRSFTQTIQVAMEDLDELNHVNNVRYVQWIQDMAKAHWLSEAGDDLLNNYFWVVVQHKIDYKAPAVLYDYINLKTYVTDTKGVRSTRVVEMYNSETNRLIVKSETIWCLMSVKTRRPCKIPSEIKTLFN